MMQKIRNGLRRFSMALNRVFRRPRIKVRGYRRELWRQRFMIAACATVVGAAAAVSAHPPIPAVVQTERG